MKKFVILILIVTMAFALVACGGGASPQEEKNDSLSEFRNRLNYNYSSVVISVETRYADLSLNDKYEITYLDDSARIKYQNESISPFEFNGEEYVVPIEPNGIVKKSGTVQLDENGAIEHGGDGLTDYSAFAKLGIDLREKYFSSLSIAENKLEGTVSDFSALCKIFSSVPASNVEMNAEFDEFTFDFISFNYKNGIGAEVSITFEFSA